MCVIPPEYDTVLKEDIYSEWKRSFNHGTGKGKGVPDEFLDNKTIQWLFKNKLVYYHISRREKYWYPTLRARKYCEKGILDPIP